MKNTACTTINKNATNEMEAMNMENRFMHYVQVGKNNKNSIPELEVCGTVYRFYNKNNFELLKTVNNIICNMDDKNREFATTCLASFLWIVEHKDTSNGKSKLAGLKSISTCCLDNKFCLARMQDCNSICHHCYASTQQSRHFGLTEHNIVNGIILKNVVLTEHAIATLPLWNEKFVRIESFGDVENLTQVLNYINIAKVFSGATFAVWTKNTALWEKAFTLAGKPENLVFVVSSCYTNIKTGISSEYIDHTFTVYSKEAIEENNIDINCGGKKCAACIAKGINCYFHDTEKDIREELK